MERPPPSNNPPPPAGIGIGRHRPFGQEAAEESPARPSQHRPPVLAKQASSSHHTLPRLASFFSASKRGRRVVVSNERAQWEVAEYSRRAWERCRDPQLPVRIVRVGE